MFRDNKKSGFTLIELIFYIALFSVFFLSLFAVLDITYKNRIKNISILEVEQQGLFVSRLISREIRNSRLINLPMIGNNSSSLSLEAFDPSRSPAIFYLDSGTVFISENLTVNNLSSPKVTISNLNFINNSIVDGIQNVNFYFTVSYFSNSNSKEYLYSKDFSGSASLNLK